MKVILKMEKKNGGFKINFNNKYLLITNFKNDTIEGKGKCFYSNGNVFEGTLNDNYQPIKGKMKYSNNDEYDGEFENLLRKGNGIMKYVTDEIYDGKWNNNEKNGKGIFCFNQNDYKKIKNKIQKIQNNIFELFNFESSIYIGNFKNNKKEGEGIFYMNKDNNNNDLFNNNIILDGKFNNGHKYGKSKIYFKNKSYFEAYWINDDKIDDKKGGIFYINDLEYKHDNFQINEWIDFIRRKSYKTIRKNRIDKTIIR